MDTILENKFAQLALSLHQDPVKVTNWLTGESQDVNVYSKITFNSFVNRTVDKLSLDMAMRLYALPPPDHDWKLKEQVSEVNFDKVVSRIIRGPLCERPKLYAHPGDVSPDSTPNHLKKTADDVSSLSSGVTDRSGQDDFKRRTMFRDNCACVFCGFNEQPLYAAHILEYAQFKEDQSKFKEYDMTGINDTCNGITLCWNCHLAFDNYLVCVCPSSNMLIVAEALQHCEPVKWQKLHGTRVSNDSKSIHWPSNKLLSHRLDLMKEQAQRRKDDRDEYPFRCKHCHSGCKTLGGLMNRHAGSQKCSNKTGKMSSYSTPCKTVIDDEERILYDQF